MSRDWKGHTITENHREGSLKTSRQWYKVYFQHRTQQITPARTQAKGIRTQSQAYQRCGWENFPTQSPVCNGDDGIPAGLDGITFPKWRNESIKAGGNAIVPQVAYQIFKAIQQYENLKK